VKKELLTIMKWQELATEQERAVIAVIAQRIEAEAEAIVEPMPTVAKHLYRFFK
jgi:hypothetical protein